jgi:hypothetical protein
LSCFEEIITNKWLIEACNKPGEVEQIRRYLKRAKYRNNKITADGQTFDSMKEYHRYLDLILMQKAGEITDLQRQVKYLLLPAQREPDQIGKRGGVKKGKLLEREVAYYADFVYKITETGETVVEDTKGVRTTEYILKRKMMLFFHNIQIKEI